VSYEKQELVTNHEHMGSAIFFLVGLLIFFSFLLSQQKRQSKDTGKHWAQDTQTNKTTTERAIQRHWQHWAQDTQTNKTFGLPFLLWFCLFVCLVSNVASFFGLSFLLYTGNIGNKTHKQTKPQQKGNPKTLATLGT
jgi:type VI protein secretion system component VasF